MSHKIQLVACALIALLVASCSDTDSEKKPVTKPQVVNYNSMELQPRQISGTVQLPGVMQPFQFVQIFPKISGFVKTVNVDRGSVVRKGQVLIVLEAPEIEQQVAAARLKYTQAQAIYITTKDRYRRLLETSHTPGTISSYDLDAAAAKMQGDSALAQGEFSNFRAQESLRNYLTITAPFDGVVTERNVHPGALAGPGSQNVKPMLILQQLSKIRLVVEIPEQFATQVKNGDNIVYRLNALPGKEFKGTVSRSSQSLSTSFRAETIEIDISNNDNIFKPGMHAEVVLPTSGSANAYVVPKSAVVTTTERKYVIKLENKYAKWIDVTEGNQNKDSVEVFGRLFPGESILVNPSYTIKDNEGLNL